MGMDVYGKNPTSGAGEYLRQNIWGWRPLWEYACEIGKLDETLRQHGHSNDGAGLESQEECDKLADALQKMVDSGHAKAKEEHYADIMRIATEWNEQLDVLHSLHRKNKNIETLAPCDYEEKDRQIYDTIRSLHNWNESYPFKEEYVIELIAFLRDCGGFEIR